MTPRRLLKITTFFLLYSLSAATLFVLAAPVPKSYERIVSLAPSTTEILFAIGAGERVKGVTTYCDYPEEAKTRPKVGGFTEHNLEAIVALKPDLVILTPNRGTKFTNEALKQMKIETLVVPFYSLDDLIQSFTLIGEKVGHLDEAKSIQSKLLDVLQKEKAKRQDHPAKKVAFVNWHSPLILAGNGSLESDIIQTLGGDNVAKKSPDRNPRWNIEAFFRYDPDLIIDASNHGRETSLEEQEEMVKKTWNRYPELRAVKNGEIYMFKENVYSVPGPRTVKLIQGVSAILNSKGEDRTEFYERIKFTSK